MLDFLYDMFVGAGVFILLIILLLVARASGKRKKQAGIIPSVKTPKKTNTAELNYDNILSYEHKSMLTYVVMKRFLERGIILSGEVLVKILSQAYEQKKTLPIVSFSSFLNKKRWAFV